jgi:ABC-2 type transport system ATP-binding protein
VVNETATSATDASRSRRGGLANYADPPVIEMDHVVRRFGEHVALREVSLQVRAGEIHALLGPNGAGKTTLIRILTGLLRSHEGGIRVLGMPLGEIGLRDYRKVFGLVPSGDRSFYLRLNGVENLMFFGRLSGLRKAQAARRAHECLTEVGLTDVGKKMVGNYSHGMQKRLSVARALLRDPVVLFVDEATHDLDPDGARRVQDLIQARADAGTAVVWATQRLDEIRGFADRVTLLHRGEVGFNGTVQQLISTGLVRAYVLRLRRDTASAAQMLDQARAALGGTGSITSQDDSDGEHYLLLLDERTEIGRVVWALEEAGIRVLSCREERSGIENAFLRLTREEPR